MATAYEQLVSEVLPYVHGCPELLAVNHIRRAAIDFCERSSAYQVELDVLSIDAGTYEYALEAPASTTVDKIMWVTYEGQLLDPASAQLIESRHPKWRTSSVYGTPASFIQQRDSVIWIAPIPAVSAPNSVVVRAALRPTRKSTSCDTQVMDEYFETILAGALARLLRIPGWAWTDVAASNDQLSIFLEGINYAKERGASANTNIIRKTKYGGIGANNRKKRRRY